MQMFDMSERDYLCLSLISTGISAIAQANRNKTLCHQKQVTFMNLM